MNEFYTRKQGELAQLGKQQQEWRVKAARCVDELNWRLNPAGGPEHIELKAAEQTMNELGEAVRKLRQIRQKMKAFPPEMQTGQEEI